MVRRPEAELMELQRERVVAEECHRNLLAHAPEHLHEEVSADYTDMIYAATPDEIETRRKAFHSQVAAQAPLKASRPRSNKKRLSGRPLRFTG
jgi:hypothetical protein